MSSIPRPASTLILMRKGDPEVEVLLTRRPDSMAFLGGALVFPGGAVESSDLDPAWEELSTMGGKEAASLLGINDTREALGYLVAALREAFEEVGLLLGEGNVEALIREGAKAPGDFLERCRELGIKLHTHLLRPAGRRITPEFSALRYDTRFFFATPPGDFAPRADPQEVNGLKWVSPVKALQAYAEGRAFIAPPTLEVLTRLEGIADLDQAERSLGVWEEGPPSTSVRLSPQVRTVLAPNPSSFTGPGTNCYVVGQGPFVVLDPGVDDPRFLSRILHGAGNIDQILVTHRHPDHVGGIAALVRATGARVRAYTAEPAGGIEVEPVEDGERIVVPGASLVAVSTPGHARDHLSFLLEEEQAVFTGDVVLGQGTSMIAPPEGDMEQYLESLERLLRLAPLRLYPGHFWVVHEGENKIREYIRHRREREEQILAALAEGAKGASEIAGQVYTDTPRQLLAAAAESVRAHLELAERRGLVRRAGEDRWELASRERP